ncbi:MAG: DUF4190 domain-containing protein [Planctomycetota bacterium]|jgi:hypothetical protein
MVERHDDETGDLEAPSRRERRQRRKEQHRGSTILVLGILGLALCFLLGIFAWVMGNEDLKKMRAGRMDRSGQGLTEAGRICGIVAVLLQIPGIIIFILLSMGTVVSQ